jgi:hypothetical protein
VLTFDVVLDESTAQDEAALPADSTTHADD